MSLKSCVIGWPIEHSRSPLIHTYWLEKYGIDGAYAKQAVAPDDLEGFLSSLRENGFAGCNVTVPHKRAALEHAACCDEAARAIGAANTLWLEQGALHASNTDGYGFLANLDEGAPGWDGNAASALVLGAGGAARAVLHALAERGFSEIILINRTRSRADDLVRHFSGANNAAISGAISSAIRAEDWEARNALAAECALLVNATTLGMTGQPPLEIDLSRAKPGCVVTDLVYAPLKTPLLEQAQEAGLRRVDGLGMLLHQAAPGFEKWFGVRPEVSSELRRMVIADLGEG